MKKLLTFFFALSGFVAAAQPNGIVYYEDSDVRHSRFSMSLNLNPNYTDRRLINDEIPAGAGFDLVDDRASGGFAFNFGADLYYALSPTFDIGLGAGRAHAAFEVERAEVYNTEAFDFGLSDTARVDAQTQVNMWKFPLKVNFHTAISDIFELEVLPAVSLVLIDKYETTFEAESMPSFTRDFTAHTQDVNYIVGLSLGGTWYFAENFGFFFRANANYMLNSMIEVEDYPRETLYSFGSDMGLKIRF